MLRVFNQMLAREVVCLCVFLFAGVLWVLVVALWGVFFWFCFFLSWVKCLTVMDELH